MIKVSVKEFYSLPLSEKVYQFISELETPETITINKVKISIPDNFGHITYGQKVLLDQYSGDNDYEMIKYFLSIVFIPDIFNIKFDVEKLNECYSYIDNCDINEALPVTKYIKNWLDEVNKIESETLGNKPDADMVLAGIERLEKHGVWSIVSDIAERFGIEPEKVFNWEYSTVYRERLYRHDLAKFDKKYRELKLKQK